MLVQYPTAWSASRDPSLGTDSVLLLRSDNVIISIAIYRPYQTLTDEFAYVRSATEKLHPEIMYTWDEPRTTSVGGKVAMSLAYSYRTDVSYSESGTFWLVDSNGRRFWFQCADLNAHGQEIIALMDSVRFLK